MHLVQPEQVGYYNTASNYSPFLEQKRKLYIIKHFDGFDLAVVVLISS